MKKSLFIVFAAAIMITVNAAEIKGKVVKVYDGDTITVLDALDGGKFRIRLLGIDAPEKGEPGDKEATEYLARRVMGKEVIIRYKAIDYYRRPLGIVYLPDGSDINAELLNVSLVKKYKK